MENSGNPWGLSQTERADWAADLEGIEIIDGTNPLEAEYLYWVGCAGSFDDKNKKVTRAMAKLLQRAGVSFAILGPSENCTGDPARRSGNEYIFQMLAMQNIESLNTMGVKKIITQCPHCFNTLMNEYPQLGGHYEVVHHSQFLEWLIDQGKLDLSTAKLEERIVYHDSCYLGRHNDVYMSPRNVIGSLDLEQTLTSRELINQKLQSGLDDVTGRWGIKVTRVEIKAIEPPSSIRDAMEKQMRAERDRRAAILHAEGVKQSQILTAEGEKQAAVLRADGERQARILQAEGQAKAIRTVFDAIHVANPDPKVLAYQYLQALPQIAAGDSNKVWVIPVEITRALEGIGGALGNLATAPSAGRQERIQPDEAVEAVAEEARAAAEQASRAAQAVKEDVDAAESTIGTARRLPGGPSSGGR